MRNVESTASNRRAGCFHRALAGAATFLVIAAMIVCADRLLVKKFGIESAPAPARHIRLREHPPRSTRYLLPSGELASPARARAASAKNTFTIRTDSGGFIEPSGGHNSPDFKLVFLGGSTTECLFMNEKSRFPFLAGRMLEKETGLKINSYNGGVSGNNSLHSIDILINKVIPMKPDAVVMMHNVNDLMTLVHEGSYYNDNKHRSVIVNPPKPEQTSTLIASLKGVFPGMARRQRRLFQEFHRRAQGVSR